MTHLPDNSTQGKGSVNDDSVVLNLRTVVSLIGKSRVV